MADQYERTQSTVIETLALTITTLESVRVAIPASVPLTFEDALDVVRDLHSGMVERHGE